jgi:hypothetical protein
MILAEGGLSDTSIKPPSMYAHVLIRTGDPQDESARLLKRVAELEGVIREVKSFYFILGLSSNLLK